MSVVILAKDTTVINVMGSAANTKKKGVHEAHEFYKQVVAAHNAANGTGFEESVTSCSCAKSHCRGTKITGGHVWIPSHGMQMFLVPACQKANVKGNTTHNRGDSETRWKVGTSTVAVQIPMSEFATDARLHSLNLHIMKCYHKVKGGDFSTFQEI